MDLVSCDPGVHHCYFAEWEGARLVYAFRGVPQTWSRGACSEHLAIEVPQVYPGMRREDPNDLIDLATSAGIVIGSAQWASVTRYRPREWKGQTPKKIDHERTLKVLTAAERSVYDGCDVAQSLRHNILDAIGIGLRHLKRK